MSGVQGHVLGHIVRRGVDAAQAHFAGPNAEIMGKLQHDAELYDQSGPEMEIKPQEMLPVLITSIIMFLLIASIRYTVGEVIASLAMIESPTTTAIVEDKPPVYADEPDAPLEKESLMPAEAEADVEVLLIKNKPITTNIRATVGHLHRVGGFRARWRGLGWSIVYHGLHAVLTRALLHLFGIGALSQVVSYAFSSVLLSRVHMLWTHSMIAAPTNKRFWNRLVPRKQCKAILLPSLCFALAQQATIYIPIAAALATDTLAYSDRQTQYEVMGLRALTVLPILVVTAYCILLPASIILTRIEAVLLSESEETIVPFDRQAVMGDVDLAVRGGSRALFVQACRSSDRATNWRLIKLYIKMFFMQVAVIFIGLHVMAAEVYLIAGERLANFIKSAGAQLQLAAIEAKQNAN